jgi:hypothetical protein
MEEYKRQHKIALQIVAIRASLNMIDFMLQEGLANDNAKQCEILIKDAKKLKKLLGGKRK